jgi:hypothetical protein
MKIPVSFVLIAFLFSACSKKTHYVNNPDAPDHLHNRPVGASANEILSGSTYTSLKVEVQYMTGFEPDAAALAHLQSMLSMVTHKSNVSIITKEIQASPNTSLSVSQVIDIERNNRTVFTSGNELALYILYTNTDYTDNNVLGVAYRNTSVALFGRKIHENSGSIGQASRTKLLATVAEHEMGHLMGLVDLGTAMQTNHKDAAHGNHCNNTSCLMYYASETTDILGFLLTGNIPSLDGNCRADLTANGGR